LFHFSAKKTPGGTARRPPLSSILDNKPTFGTQNHTDEGFYSQSATPGPGYMGSEYDSAVDSARKFPLVGSDTLRSEFTNTATGRLGLNTGAGFSTAQPGFGSPTPARPPLRSVLDGYSGRAGAFDTKTPTRYSAGETGGRYAHQDESEVDEHSRKGGDRITSPVLTLAPYTPAGGVQVRPVASALCCLPTSLLYQTTVRCVAFVIFTSNRVDSCLSKGVFFTSYFAFLFCVFVRPYALTSLHILLILCRRLPGAAGWWCPASIPVRRRASPCCSCFFLSGTFRTTS
jgi:hypothetical protein